MLDLSTSDGSLHPQSGFPDKRQISRGKLHRLPQQPSDSQPVPLMDMGFAVSCQLARHRMPPIRFLYIGSYVCSTLLSDPRSLERPCASL